MSDPLDILKAKLAHHDHGIRALALMDVHAMLPQIMDLWESIESFRRARAIYYTTGKAELGPDAMWEDNLDALNARAAEVLGA